MMRGCSACSRRALLAAVPGALATLGAGAAWAQPFPNRPLKVVLPNAAGGAADVTARALAEKLGPALGQSVVVENKPSAGGVVAAEQVARAPADGHTLLLVSSGTAVSAALFKSLPFDTLGDFAPVSMLATFDLAIVVSQSAPFKTLADLLAYGRANPGRLNIGTPNIGTTQNLAAELFKLRARLQAQVVPFNGTPAAITALRGGDIDAVVDILGPLLPHIASRALRPLALLGDRRAAQLSELPTVGESGASLAGFHVSSWNGLAVPAKTPGDVVARLNREVRGAMALPELQRRLLAQNLVAQGSTPEELGQRLQSDIRRWREVIARAGLARR